jgi:hypothetical protein
MLTAVLALATATPFPDEDSNIHDTTSHGAPFLGSEISWVLGAVLLVAALVFFWAVFIRKRPQTQRGSFVVTRARPEDKNRGGSSGRRRRRKRRPDHPENLPRNPTLAEIGGLPPLRPEDEPPPGQDPAASPEAQR